MLIFKFSLRIFYWHKNAKKNISRNNIQYNAYNDAKQSCCTIVFKYYSIKNKVAYS